MCKDISGLRLANPWGATLQNLYFHPLEVVSRYRDPQVQVGENYPYLLNLGLNICKSQFLNPHSISKLLIKQNIKHF